MENSKPLHAIHAHKSSTIINKANILLHSLAVTFLVYYRINNTSTKQTLTWLLLFFSELLLFAMWLIERAFRWRPISRTVFPERLPADENLPAIDIFIFTADPDREPTVRVMNTVVSAMAMDYPPEKLHVYLSDDAGSALTLNGMREAWGFATSWVLFCRRFRVQVRCPEAYFSSEIDGGDCFGESSDEFLAEEKKLKEKYQEFKERLRRFKETFEDSTCGVDKRDHHPSVIEVIQGNHNENIEQEESMLPRLVYISREKRTSQPHHFKAGATNTLLRVSGVMSNSPFILALDCDMYCNDPTSARQAMCFHLDPEISSSLAFVQFPQRFHNVAKNDIYDSQLRSIFSVSWLGFDGLDGPSLTGTGFFLKRVSLYGNIAQQSYDAIELKKYFGQSNEFIKSLLQNDKKPNNVGREFSNSMLEETKFLASCTYESGTKWGQEVGFLHYSVVEDYLTGFVLQSKGWKSIYLNPLKPQFLGTGVTNLNDLLTQGTRWTSGLLEVGISKFCPLTYGPSKMPFLKRMCYVHLAFFPIYCLPLWCLATIPQLCLLNGISLYPEVSNPFFFVFLFIFTSTFALNFYDVLTTGGSFRSLINEQRVWMIKSVTSHLYGTIDALMKRIGMREASFLLTNKADDEEQVKLYEKGLYDFRTSTMFLAPMVAIVMLNMVSFLVGIGRAFVMGDLGKMFVQLFISFYILAINYPIIDGMVLRKDKGSIPKSITILSAKLVMFMVVFFLVGDRFLM